MRLSPDVVAEAPQVLNCVGDRELCLRDLAIPVIENLATARDGFDTIDLSGNAIADLTPGSIPPFPRLGALYVGSNRIRAVHDGFTDSIVNLHTLILSCNAIESINELNVPELGRLKKLEVLAYSDNPVAADEEVRLLLIHRIPSLKFINFRKVSQDERNSAVEKHGPQPMPERATSEKKKKPKKRKRAQKATPSDAGGEASKNPAKSSRRKKTLKPVALSSAQIEAVKQAIASASSVDQVLALQEAMQAGDVSRVLQLIPSSN